LGFPTSRSFTSSTPHHHLSAPLEGLGSPAEAKVFNLNIAKLDPKTVTCDFIGYPDRSKGYHFYCLDKYTKFVETRHAVFLEDELMRGSMVAGKLILRRTGYMHLI
jgi:hypothetical protein